MNLIYVEDEEGVLQFINDVSTNEHQRFYIDTETTGLDTLVARLLLLQIGYGNNGYVFNVTKLHKTAVLNIINLVHFTGKVSVYHNSKYDLKVLKNYSNLMLTNVYDTMYSEVLLNAGKGKKFYSLVELTEKYCGVYRDKEIRLLFVDEKYLKGEHDFTNEQIQYAIEDIAYMETIYNKQMEQVLEDGLATILDVEMKLLPVVSDMEHQGVVLDTDLWLKLLNENLEIHSKLYAELMDSIFSAIPYNKFYNAVHALETFKIPFSGKARTKQFEETSTPIEIEHIVRERFNLNSNNQLKSFLEFVIGTELTGVSEDVIVKLNEDSKLPETAKKVLSKILEYRQYEKAVSTYGEKFLGHIHPKTGRIHATFNSLGTRTGRFSSSGPNLQNIKHDAEYRNAFVAREGYKFIGIDYSQQELRLAGALSGDPIITDAYVNNKDIHKASAAIQFHKAIEEVTKEERSLGKTLNFAIVYGTTAFGLHKNLEIPEKEAQTILDRFFEGYFGLAKFKELVEEKVLELGYSVTAMGRRRYLTEKPMFGTPYDFRRIDSKNRRTGFNHVIQGTAADITKLAMVNLYYNNPYGEDLKILLQVHDEIICEVREDLAEEAYRFMQKTMEDAEQQFLGKIPAVAEGYISHCWEKD